jgi:hypothetical protein
MSLSLIDRCAAWVLDCLNSPDRAEPLLALSSDPQLLARMTESEKPHPLVGIVTAMMAGALISAGRPGEVEATIERVADLFAPRHRVYVRGSNFGDLIGAFPYLHLPAIRAFLAMGDYETAFSAVLHAAYCLRHEQRWILPDDPTLAPILAHPGIAAYGPFSIERDCA